MNKTTLNMTEGPIARQMLAFGFPVFLSALLNQLYVIVDTLIVSTFLGDSALAAVSNCENLAWFITSFVFGLGMGMGVVIAQAFGAREYDWMRRTEGTGVAGAFILSVLMVVVGLTLSKPLLVLMQTPEDVFGGSVEYLSMYISGCGGLLLFNICSGISQSVGDSKIPLYFLALSAVCNIGMDLLFIAIFHTGVVGAAAATVIAEWISGILMLMYLFHVKGEHRIERKNIRIHSDCLKEILRMGIPGAIESSAVALANSVVQGFLNTFGSSAMAASGAFGAIEGFGFLPIVAFEQSLSTFTGQNVGAGKRERCLKGCRFGLWVMSGMAFVIGMIILINARAFLNIFVHTPASMELALLRGKITLWFYPLLGLTHCFAAILRGAGKPMVPMMAYLGSWGIIRIIILASVLPFWHDFSVLCWVYPITWAISALGLFLYYRNGKWFPASNPTFVEVA